MTRVTTGMQIPTKKLTEKFAYELSFLSFGERGMQTVPLRERRFGL